MIRSCKIECGAAWAGRASWKKFRFLVDGKRLYMSFGDGDLDADMRCINARDVETADHVAIDPKMFGIEGELMYCLVGDKVAMANYDSDKEATFDATNAIVEFERPSRGA